MCSTFLNLYSSYRNYTAVQVPRQVCMYLLVSLTPCISLVVEVF